MVSPVGLYAALASGASRTVARAPEPAEPAPPRHPRGATNGPDRVTISASGHRRAVFASIVTDAMNRLPGRPDAGADPGPHLERARARLEALDGGQGGRATLTSRGDGHLAAQAEPAAWAEALRGDRELGDALTAADTAARIARIGEQVAHAYRAAEADPARDREHYARAGDAAERVLGEVVRFEYAHGGLGMQMGER